MRDLASGFAGQGHWALWGWQEHLASVAARAGCTRHEEPSDGAVVLKAPQGGFNQHAVKTTAARLLMRHCIKFTPNPSHSSLLAVATQARRQGLSPIEKKSSSQVWDHQNEGLLNRTNGWGGYKKQKSLAGNLQHGAEKGKWGFSPCWRVSAWPRAQVPLQLFS